MSAVIVIALIFALGLACCLAWGPRRDALLCCALAFPVGLAAVSLLALASLYFNTRLLPTMALGVGISFGLAIHRALARWRPGKRDILLIGAAGVFFVGLAALFHRYDTTFFTYVSYRAVFAAQQLTAPLTAFDHSIFAILSEAGPLTIATQIVADALDLDFFPAQQPLLLCSTIAVVGCLVRHAAHYTRAPLWATWLTAIATMLVLALQDQLLHAGLYLHHSSLTTTYLTMFVCTWWLAELHSDKTMTPVAWLSLAALFATSDTGTGVGLTVLVIAIFATSLDIRGGLAAFIVVLLAYLGGAAEDFSRKDFAVFFTANEARALLFAVIAIYAAWATEHRRVAAFLQLRWVGRALFTLAGAAIAVLALSDTDVAVEVWQGIRRWNWNVTWFWAIAVALVAGYAAQTPWARLFAAVVPATAIGTLLLTPERPPEFFWPPFGELHLLLATGLPAIAAYAGIEIVWRFGERADRPQRAPSAPPAAPGLAFTALLLGTLAFNLHSLGVQHALGRTKRLDISESVDMSELAREAGSTITQKYSLFFVLDDAIDGGEVLIDDSLASHVGYLANIVDLSVAIGDYEVPGGVTERLDRLAEDNLVLRTSSHNKDVKVIIGEGVDRWVFAPAHDNEVLYWIPESLYRDIGGQL